VLIIDEAQNLTNDTMEEIRMLSNIETEKHHLIQIILVGQPELRFKLQQSNLKQFAQRVTVQCHLKGLEKDEVKEYIKHRLEVGGGERFDIFDLETIEKISDYSRGIPRLINILCDSALVYGFADGLETISTAILDNVYEELKALGTFTDYDANPSANPLAPKSSSVVSVALDDARIQLLEGKVLLLEEKVGDFKDKLELLIDKRIERDDIVIELLKMLRDNLGRRGQLIAKLKAAHNPDFKPDDSNKTGDGQAVGLSKVSSLEKHIQKKN
jgi:general secretion pathway protein A